MIVPARFTEFVRALGVRLTRAQRVVALVAYDGVDPSELTGRDRKVAREIFGDVEAVPDEARGVFVAVCGARAGKSYVLCGLRLLHLALTVAIDTLAAGEQAAALIVAPDMRLARQTLRFALGAVKANGVLADLLVSESSDGFALRRESGRTVTVECLPATRGGSAVRGRSLVGAVLDECAFFRDRDFVVNDEEVFKAVAPRIVPGGQLILASTPWAEAGLLYELFRDNHGDPSGALAAHAPTLLLRDDARTRSIVERERLRDPDNALREFDAQFITAGSGLFLDPVSVEACVDDELFIPTPALDRRATFGGADFGFRVDSSACAIAERRRDAVVLVALNEQRPKRGAPLKPSAVAGDFAALARSYGLRELAADSHYAESIREHLRDHDVRLKLAPEGQAGKVSVYLELRRLVNERRLRFPRHPRLIAQLKALTSKPTSAGGLQISSPRRGTGGHGDLVSALTLAVWRANDGKRERRTAGTSWLLHRRGQTFDEMSLSPDLPFNTRN